MKTLYRVAEFAKLAGVTVRTLQYRESPAAIPARYLQHYAECLRMYSDAEKFPIVESSLS
jgi:DNA-binding transcriptional MerR regulator